MQNLTYKVHMLAFEDTEKVREVDIPENEVYACNKDVFQLLERVFYYGQNDFQPKPICSVSMGDVAEIDGKFYLCMGCGWEEITDTQLENYRKVPREERSLLCYGKINFLEKCGTE